MDPESESTMAYSMAPKVGFPGRFFVFGGSAAEPYVVHVGSEWRGARCSCPDGIFRARKRGSPCRHEAFVRSCVGHALGAAEFLAPVARAA